MINYDLSVVLNYPAVLGESPVWDERNGVLYWVDSLDNKAFRFDPKTGENRVYEVGQNIGSFVLRENGNALIGLQDGLYSLDTSSGAMELMVDPEPELPGNRLNDAKADAKGRLWIGSMVTADSGWEGFDTDYRCNLHMVDTHFKSTVKDPEVRLSNGMAWTEDNKVFYYIDSPSQAVYAYDFDLEKGEISNRRIVIQIPKSFGICDGMDIDVDGNLWIAHWTGWCVGKWDPRTGALLGTIDLPVCRVASCAFGGPDFDELYIVTAKINVDQDGREQPTAGFVYVAKNLGTKGKPFYRFQG
jgi:sugar lactone lactonase YvrE